MDKSKIGKIITTVASVAVIVGVGIFVYNHIEEEYASSENPGIGVQLATPKDVSFDGELFVLSWGKVENAESYKIYYNGSVTTVDATDTQETVALAAEENVFKVMAVGDGMYYVDSEWSNAVTYTVEKEEISIYNKVNFRLAQFAEEKGLELVEILGISFADVEGNHYGQNIIFQTICNKDGKQINYAFAVTNAEYSSLSEMLYNIEVADIKTTTNYSVVDYNSAQILLKSGAYDGEMQRLTNDGYTISVIKSCVREGEKVGSGFVFEIVGTYKAVRGNEVIYFTSVNRIRTAEGAYSPKEVDNYENSLKFPHVRKVTETEFMLHEFGTTMDYMQEWADEKEKEAVQE